MAESTRRIVVTDAHTPLGGALMTGLRACPDVERVLGVVRHDREVRLAEHSDAVEVIPFVPDQRAFSEFLEKESIDSVVQSGLLPDRSGGVGPGREADVIGTMCLGAAIAREGSTVRSWVLASSSAAYPVGSHTPLLHDETARVQPGGADPFAASILEAEEYARDVAHRLPHVNVAILRLQHGVGPGFAAPLARLLALRRVPVPIGFDPAIQLLHLDDAVSALAFAARQPLSGLYNVASRGLVHWRDAVRLTGHAAVPVLPLGVAALDALVARLGLPMLPAELLDVMRFGHAVDTRKIERAGWRPRWSQRQICEWIGKAGDTIAR